LWLSKIEIHITLDSFCFHQLGDCIVTTVYKYFNVMLDGLQGLMVSIAFCYRNGEVIKFHYCTT